ncbi:MAG: hypothetical protein MRZ85_07705 [Clostridium sp.]|nr:hypothetical protein [Clostridium sp.]
MRKRYKNQAWELLNTLQEMHAGIQDSLLRYDENTAMDLLEQCQQGAVALGNMLEQLSEGTENIPLLENYCEEIYRISEALASSEEETDAFFEAADGILEQVKANIRLNISDSFEMVFMPYKAAMWDSMESIWKEAKRDEACEVYVVPIPYFEKNADGSVREMHYEKDLYPAEVNAVDYREYSLENRMPEAIVIHSPYDDCNIITSVLPVFYSDRLKQYTDELVYVPYYVSGGAGSEMHRCLPAYANVDYIIAQGVKQVPYFDSQIQDKVVALGSPKFDKVINMEKDGCEIPEEWKKRIHDKVFFVNTGINGLLNNDSNSLLKILYLLKAAIKEKVTLLWRPHPLLESTIRTMRPQLMPVYREVMNTFQKYPYGILDYSPEIERAIVLADAYIGEATSSVCHLFGVTGKPLFFIKQAILSEDSEAENLKISSCLMDAEQEGIMYAVAAGRNGLLKIRSSGEIEKIYIIPGEAEASNLYIDMLQEDGKLYLIPRNAKQIAVFDTKTEGFRKIEVPEPAQKEKFNKGILYDGFLFLIPRTYPALVKMSCTDYSVQYLEEPVNRMKKENDGRQMFCMAGASAQQENRLFCASAYRPLLLEYRLDNGESKIHLLEGQDGGFGSMDCMDGKVILGCLTENKIIVRDMENGQTVMVNHFPGTWEETKTNSFEKILALQSGIYIFPRKNNAILKLSAKDYTLQNAGDDFPFSLTERKSPFYNHPNHFLMVKKAADDKIIFQDANRHGITVLDGKDNFTWTPVQTSVDAECDAIAQSFAPRGKNLPWGVCETKYISAGNFMEYVRRDMHDWEKQREKFSHIAENLDGTAGIKIYEFIKEKAGLHK